LGLLYNGENPNDAFLLGVQVRSYTSIRDLDSISMCCPDYKDDERGEALITPPGVRSFRRQTLTS